METSKTSEWTDADLQKLLSRIKSQIVRKHHKMAYYAGLKRIDWKTVAFAPYSPVSCFKKWNSVMAKMRKFRNLQELVEEAESRLQNVYVAQDVEEDVLLEEQQMPLAESQSPVSDLRDQCHEASEFECGSVERMLYGQTHTDVSAEEKNAIPSDSEDVDLDDSSSISVTSDYEEYEENEDEEDGFGDVGFDLL
ncbi:uncharacterized protein ACB058_002460 [Synchiropus picturatus]